MGDEQPETLMLHLSRPDSGLSWGFRLQGGVDFNTPLSVQVVQPKSVAERCGLRAGDGILKINNTNTDSLSHEQAKMEIIRSCNDISMLVTRGAVQIWKPKVTKMQDLKPQELQPVSTATGDQLYTVQKTSLAKDQQNESSNIGSSYNRSAKPFGGGVASQPQYGAQAKFDGEPLYTGKQQSYVQNYANAPESPKRAVPNVVHAQFNSPIGLYSANNIAHTYAQQTAGIQKQMENLDIEAEPLGTRMTGTYHRLDSLDKSQSYGTQYGSPTSPTSPPGDDPVDSITSGSPASESSDRLLHPVNGVCSDEHVPFKTNETNNNMTAPAGFRSVSAPVAQVPSVSAGPKPESMHCTGCGNLVTGVFVRIKGMPYHEKCFKCVKCGVFLKQKGYFQIEGQLYCETHAKMVAQPPGENLRAAGAVYR